MGASSSSVRARFEVRELVFSQTGAPSYNWPEAARHLLETTVVDSGNMDNITKRIVKLIEHETGPREEP
jgi:hypothetical protein